MIKEILFRGKRIDNGEWIYGYYVPVCFGRFPCKPAIVPEPDGIWEPIAVKPETIGQYTGLTDKNSKKIFDGDILKEYGSDPEHSLMIIKNVGFGCFIEFYFHGEKHSTEQVGHTGWLSYDEVIGNIHDNSELLEVTK